MEIQRLIGRSLRAVVDPILLGNRTFIIDCDVLQADGGTRTLSITGAYVALYQALKVLIDPNNLKNFPLKHAVAGISAGLVNGDALLDLCYAEDSKADVDFNVVKTDTGELVEIQATAEGHTFTKETMENLLTLADFGINSLFETQQQAIKDL
jgi:ribonuclease PH